MVSKSTEVKLKIERLLELLIKVKTWNKPLDKILDYFWQFESKGSCLFTSSVFVILNCRLYFDKIPDFCKMDQESYSCLEYKRNYTFNNNCGFYTQHGESFS